MRFASCIALCLASGLGFVGFAYAADPDLSSAPTLPPNSTFSYDPNRFEIRGGFFDSTHGPDSGTADANGEVVFPKIFSAPGWQDVLIPRLSVGGMGSLAAGRTSYAYAGALWTVNFDRYFSEIFFGGSVHSGPPDQSYLGCQYLYHTGLNLGYRFDQNWSVMATFDHVSDGEPVLSDCPSNRGLNLFGVRVGYSF